MSDQELVDKMERVWRSIDELCSSLDEEDWKRPTDCPAWTVQDHLSHLVGSESQIFLERPAPEHTPADTSHVQNPIGELNEVQVDYRRSWPPQRVLDEFREVTGERLRQMRSWGDEDFSRESRTPVGPGQVRDFMQIRIFDAWVHEQDIRRAVGVPGHLEGPVAEHAFGRIEQAMPYVVGKKAAAPNGTTVVFEITGPAGGTIPITVEGGRARPLDAVPGEATVRLTMDLETFNCLGCGRWDAGRAREAERVQITGDEELGRRIIEQMSFMI